MDATIVAIYRISALTVASDNNRNPLSQETTMTTELALTT